MKIYKGIFYWLYEMGEHAPSKWASHWKAYTLMAVLEIWLVGSAFFYIGGYFNIILKVSPKIIYISVGIFYLVKNYFIFEKDDNWVEYVKYFRGLSKEERRKSLITTITLLFICILNIILSIYYLSSSK